MEIDFREAIELMRQGKEKGFNLLFNATYQQVFNRAKQCTKTYEDAEDVTVVVYSEAYKNIDKLQAPEATLSWLYEITYRQACKMYRGEREKKETLLTTENEGIFDTVESIDISTLPELSVDQKETAQIIREIIEELPEQQKMAILSFHFDEMKLEDIASMMDCSVNTVKSRLNYGRKYIKDKVEEKEKKGNYKLHVFTLPTLLWALRLLTEEVTVTAQQAQKMYNASCAAVGLEAALPVATGVTDVTASTAASEVTAGAKGVFAVGGKAISIKTLAIVGLLIGAGIGGATYAYQHSVDDGDKENIEKLEASVEENNSDAEEFDTIELIFADENEAESTLEVQESSMPDLSSEETENEELDDEVPDLPYSSEEGIDFARLIGEWEAEDGTRFWIATTDGYTDGATIEFIKEHDIGWSNVELVWNEANTARFEYRGGGNIEFTVADAEHMRIYYALGYWNCGVDYVLVKPGYEYYSQY